MKKLSVVLASVLVILAMFTLIAGAAEVIYENDFSDPATLADFKQFRAEWAIKDGKLYMTDKLDTSLEGNVPATTFSHIVLIPKDGQLLKDYTVEVDYMNVQTAGGILFNVDFSRVDTQNNGLYGYLAFISNDATKPALGNGSATGGWAGNIYVAESATTKLGQNLHLTVTVNGDKVTYTVADKDNGAQLFTKDYTIGESTKDALWGAGTVGFRMRAEYEKTGGKSANNAYFDNLKVTSLGDAPAATTPAETTAPTETTAPVEPVTPAATPFTDVAAGAWYATYIDGVYAKGLMTGESATKFNPEGNLTVAAAVTMAVRLNASFNKVDAPVNATTGAWYDTYVAYAIEKGIITADMFADYGKNATRAEMAYIFAHALPDSEYAAVNKVETLPDVAADAKYSAEIFKLYNAGILTGNDANRTFTPDSAITRAQAAAIILRLTDATIRVTF